MNSLRSPLQGQTELEDLGSVEEPPTHPDVSLDASIPEPRALPQAAEETPPFTLYVQKRGLQNGKDSYHDTLGHTYIRKIDRRREHLRPIFICYVRRKKTSNHDKAVCSGRVLQRNGVYVMTKPHDICCPDPKAAEVRAMRHKLKKKACKDPHGSAMEMVEQYYLKKDIENNRPLYGDNFPSKVQLAAQMNAKRSKKRPRHPTDMDFEFNHHYVLKISFVLFNL